MQSPVFVLNTETKRETGREAQLQNIAAAKAVADVIRTCLGPRSMLKMVLDPVGGINMTNDGNSILREIDVAHPAAKSMIEISRTQDDEVGDGTTSVIILAGEFLTVAEPWVVRGMHPTEIISSFVKAKEEAIRHLKSISKPINTNNDAELLKIVQSCIGTKFIKRFEDQMCLLAIDAVRTVASLSHGKLDIDIKRYAKIERIPGGEIDDCRVIKGVLMTKDVVHAKMRRKIENPRILLLDCDLEFKKAESMTDIELVDPKDFEAALRAEEEYIEEMIGHIAKFKPDIVVTEKGMSDLAQHYLVKHNITGFRRLRQTENNRLARAVGATIVNRVDEIKESDIGTGSGLFEVRKIGDEYFTFIEECKDPKACTILLRGASKDVLKEVERNLNDALATAKNVMMEPVLVPGGGASEMSIAHRLTETSKSLEGPEQGPYKSLAIAMEVIPRTLAQNCGARTVRVITELRAKHAQDPAGNSSWGINGTEGVIADMTEYGVWEPYTVKAQSIKTAIEAACMMLRVDEIVSGLSKGKASSAGAVMGEDMETD
eukprot:TRINITY_DN1814_c0_g1_i1.p1 TRINITY_DN1814_c0_g1~~TRINITY_DN1814_c0_g1_i1.p1  ORF type:complete len:546 (-),score=308.20 TRINITY_DN1814_c0_g1_i1:69-1706(-)